MGREQGPKDLRSFLGELERQAPQELVVVKKEVDPARFEVSAILMSLIKKGRFPTILFERPRSIAGETSYARLLMNLFASHRKTEVALGLKGVSRQTLVEEYARREEMRTKPVVVRKTEAPVKEVIRQGNRVDLSQLPIVRHFEMDGNPYVDTAVVAYDDQYGYNASFLRMMYLDPNHLAIHMSPRHQWTYLQRHEVRGEPLPLAVVIGHHPAFYLGSLTLAPIEADEYEIIGGLMGQPLRVTPSEAYGEELLVPADAELIIEGKILPGCRVVEGPFGEWTGYTGPQRLRWVVEIEAITHRRDPIYSCAFSSQTVTPESHYLNLATEAGLFKAVKRAAPSVQAVACMGPGLRPNIVISMKKRMEGEPVSAALAALAITDYAKNVILVDDDIDPWHLPDVMWAVGMRLQPDRDVTIIKNKKGSTLDPSTVHEVATSAMIIDATIPLSQPYERVVNIPDWVQKKMKLEDYVSADWLAKAHYPDTIV